MVVVSGERSTTEKIYVRSPLTAEQLFFVFVEIILILQQSKLKVMWHIIWNFQKSGKAQFDNTEQ